MCPRLFSHLLLFATSLAYASVLSTKLSRTAHELSLVNLTSTSNNLSDASNPGGDDWSWYCTQTHRWSTLDFQRDDCTGMLDWLFLETMHDGGRTLMQFRMAGSKASRFLETQWTPRKYTYGRSGFFDGAMNDDGPRCVLKRECLPFTFHRNFVSITWLWLIGFSLSLISTSGTCTLAMVMVRDFPNPASLPGGYKTGPDSDFSTYYTVWTIADALVHQCVLRNGEMGWQTAGMDCFIS